jgi:hypothetical protein
MMVVLRNRIEEVTVCPLWGRASTTDFAISLQR